MGIDLINGVGGKRDPARGLVPLQRSRSAGVVRACGLVGEAGLGGVPGAPRRQEAIKMLQKACDAGDDHSCQVIVQRAN